MTEITRAMIETLRRLNADGSQLMGLGDRIVRLEMLGLVVVTAAGHVAITAEGRALLKSRTVAEHRGLT